MTDARELRDLQQEHARLARLLRQAVDGFHTATNLIAGVRERAEHLVEASAVLGERIDQAMGDAR